MLQLKLSDSITEPTRLEKTFEIIASKHTLALRGKYYRQQYCKVQYFNKYPLNQSRFSLIFKQLLVLCVGQIFQNYTKYIF